MNTELSPRATELVNCARALLASGGYNSFSYADISKSVGISKASIHHHFPSKADLVKTVLVRYREEATAGMAMLKTQISDPLMQLQAYIGYWEKCISEGDSPLCICALLAAELPAIPEAVAEEVRGHFQDLTAWLASVLKHAAEQGSIALHSNAQDEAMVLMATVHGAMLSARTSGDPTVFIKVTQLLVNKLKAKQ